MMTKACVGHDDDDDDLFFFFFLFFFKFMYSFDISCIF